jgi:hypothetical protein
MRILSQNYGGSLPDFTSVDLIELRSLSRLHFRDTMVLEKKKAINA